MFTRKQRLLRSTFCRRCGALDFRSYGPQLFNHSVILPPGLWLDRITSCGVIRIGSKYSPQAEQVLVSLACTLEEIIVSVQDFGIGIPTDSQERVFERFYRGSSNVEQRFPGLGIGLHIAHQIIGHHSGRIWVESVQGQGSTFSFALPLKRGGDDLFENRKAAME